MSNNISNKHSFNNSRKTPQIRCILYFLNKHLEIRVVLINIIPNRSLKH